MCEPVNRPIKAIGLGKVKRVEFQAISHINIARIDEFGHQVAPIAAAAAAIPGQEVTTPAAQRDLGQELKQLNGDLIFHVALRHAGIDAGRSRMGDARRRDDADRFTRVLSTVRNGEARHQVFV
jgi:hypothetical protein